MQGSCDRLLEGPQASTWEVVPHYILCPVARICQVLLSGALGLQAQARCLSLLVGGFDGATAAAALCTAHLPSSLLHTALNQDVSRWGNGICVS